MNRESKERTAYGVHCNGVDPEYGAGPCNGGKIIYLTEEEYLRQLNLAWSYWRCPRCNAYASWDDDNMEEMESSLMDDLGA